MTKLQEVKIANGEAQSNNTIKAVRKHLLIHSLATFYNFILFLEKFLLYIFRPKVSKIKIAVKNLRELKAKAYYLVQRKYTVYTVSVMLMLYNLSKRFLKINQKYRN